MEPAPFARFASRLFLDRHLDFWLRELDPLLALRELRARIVAIVDETPGVKTFTLRPGRRWVGHAAGQYVPVEVEIDGVRVRRCYSISSAPDGGRRFAITVKRIAGGRVSGWLHERARVGDLVTLGVPGGDFVLPDPRPGKLLFVTGGSGITPVFAILSDLDARGALGDVVVLHHAKTRSEVIFRDRLLALAERHAGLRLIVRCTREGAERLGDGVLAALVPDFAEREAFVCGPAPLLAAVDGAFARCGLAGRVRRERFLAAPAPASGRGTAGNRVVLTRSGLAFASDGERSLLEQAERAGGRPAYGCRMGICRTCRCRKTRGTVENLLTGELSSEPDEEVQLCISVPRSDVELAL